MSFEAEIVSAVSQIANLKQTVIGRLKSKIRNLPGNPAVKRLSSNPRAFVISSSAFLGSADGQKFTNWTPAFHDFQSQYDDICEQLDRKQVHELLPFLRGVSNGTVQRKDGSRCISYHPTVRKAVGDILAGKE